MKPRKEKVATKMPRCERFCCQLFTLVTQCLVRYNLERTLLITFVMVSPPRKSIELEAQTTRHDIIFGSVLVSRLFLSEFLCPGGFFRGRPSNFAPVAQILGTSNRPWGHITPYGGPNENHARATYGKFYVPKNWHIQIYYLPGVQSIIKKWGFVDVKYANICSYKEFRDHTAESPFPKSYFSRPNFHPVYPGVSQTGFWPFCVW